VWRPGPEGKKEALKERERIERCPGTAGKKEKMEESERLFLPWIS
jgi:hypothetical protein